MGKLKGSGFGAMGLQWRRGGGSGRRGTVSVLVTSSESGRSWSWTVSFNTARALIILLSLFPLILLGFIGLAVRVGSDSLRMQGLAAENDSLQRQHARIQHLEAELEQMISLGNQMRVLAGVDSQAGAGDKSLPWEAAEDDSIRPGSGETDGAPQVR